MKNHLGHTPLHTACIAYHRKQHVEQIRFLVHECPELLEPDGDTNVTISLHLLCELSSNGVNLSGALKVLAISADNAVKAGDDLLATP